MSASDRQLVVVTVIFLAAVGSTAFLVSTGALGSDVFTAIVGAVVGAVAGMLNPQTPKSGT